MAVNLTYTTLIMIYIYKYKLYTYIYIYTNICEYIYILYVNTLTVGIRKTFGLVRSFVGDD